MRTIPLKEPTAEISDIKGASKEEYKVTKFKRYISVIVLAAFTVMLLAGCNGIGDVDDISEKTKNENKLYYLSIMQDNSMTAQLYKLALWYANLDGGDENAMDATGATRYNYDGGLTSGSYYYVGNSIRDTGTLLNSLNNMVKYYGDREISFKLYESTLHTPLGREVYILGFTITIFDDDDDDDDDDEPTSSGCTNGCECNGDSCSCGNCSCSSDTYSPCICGN